MSKQPREGNHILKVFYCFGCQACLEEGENNTLIRGEHALEMEDVTNKVCDLLSRAADKLQDYCSDASGDLNDSLAAEIKAFLGTVT